MIEWSTLDVDRIWPLWLAIPAFVALAAIWFGGRRAVFPDMTLITGTRRLHGLPDRFAVIGGFALLALLTLVMIEPSAVLNETVELRARDFVILCDTSRSMRHDTRVRRDAINLHFRRRAGAFLEAVDNPDTLRFVGRFELARESLYRFLNDRHVDDRVALIYYNDDVHPVSALTGDVGFVAEQLASMDDYVNWGTNIAAAMDSGLKLLERYPGGGRRTMILITDAETRFTKDLEEQFARLANAGLSFYLLWITAEGDGLGTDDAEAFLELAKSSGSVVRISDPDAENLQAAFSDISRSEAHRYVETRRRSINLTTPIKQVARILFLVWLLFVATLWHPVIDRRLFETGP